MTSNPPLKIVAIRDQQDVIVARQEGRALASKLGFSAVEQARVTTAISELARNIVVYGVRGQVSFTALESGPKKGIEIIFDDEGPGIENLEQAMQQGFTSGKGLGAGLPGSQRLMDEFDIANKPEGGLRIVTRKWK